MKTSFSDSLNIDQEEKEANYPLSTATDLDPLMDRVGNASFVLLGEASHGTHEYYVWRAEITKRLIREKGFRVIAVEGDWPDCYRINRYIKGYDDQDKAPREVLKAFRRWPTWMWANWEIVALVEWLKTYNNEVSVEEQIGFYGLDVYSLWESMEEILNYLSIADPEAAQLAQKAFNCFEPYHKDEYSYAKGQFSVSGSCRQSLINLLAEIRRKSPIYDHDPEGALNVEQNAYVAVDAEAYYASMMNFDNHTWNLRDTHMAEALQRLVDFHGCETKVVIWGHNTHVGDARYTDMVKSEMINIGQLLRQKNKEQELVAVGFGSYQGSVTAGERWGAVMQETNVPPAMEKSFEAILHEEYGQNRLLIFDREQHNERFQNIIPQRAIGVVYHPENEKHENYVPSIVNGRYDAFLYFEKSRALHPLHFQPDGSVFPETYPFNF